MIFRMINWSLQLVVNQTYFRYLLSYMGYIVTLPIVFSAIDKKAVAFSPSDIIRAEKLLKAEKQLNSNLSTEKVEAFLASIRHHPEGVDFLMSQQVFLEFLNGKKINFDTTAFKDAVNMEDEDFKVFLETYLKDDVLQLMDESFNKKNYGRLQKLLRYRNWLPEMVWFQLVSKLDKRLDYVFENLDLYIGKRTLYDEDFFKLINWSGDEELKRKVRRIEQVSTSYSNKIVSKPGIVAFFYIMGNGLNWLGAKATTIEERIEKKHALRDLKFISIILGIIVILVGGAAIYGNEKARDRKERSVELKQEAFSNSIYGLLTIYDTDSIGDIQDVPVKTGANPFGEQKPNRAGAMNIGNNVLFVNKSSYDVVILSDDEVLRYFNLGNYRYFLRAGDSLTVKQKMKTKLYMGKQFAIFKSKEITNEKKIKTYKRLPRFAELPENAMAIIKYGFKFKERVEFIEEEGEMIVRSNHFFNSLDYRKSKRNVLFKTDDLPKIR